MLDWSLVLDWPMMFLTGLPVLDWSSVFDWPLVLDWSLGAVLDWPSDVVFD